MSLLSRKEKEKSFLCREKVKDEPESVKMSVFCSKKHFVSLHDCCGRESERTSIKTKVLKTLKSWQRARAAGSQAALYFQVCYITDWRKHGRYCHFKETGWRLNTIFTNVHLRRNCLALTIVAAVKHFWINYNNNIYDHITIIYYQSKSKTFYFCFINKHLDWSWRQEIPTSQPMTRRQNGNGLFCFFSFLFFLSATTDHTTLACLGSAAGSWTSARPPVNLTASLQQPHHAHSTRRWEQ